MADIKTKPGSLGFETDLQEIEDPEQKADCRELAAIMQQLTDTEPILWGAAIVGFESYHYKYESGREGDMCLTGFSSRKKDLTIYLIPGIAESETLLATLGRHRTSKSCLYGKRLADIDRVTLAALIERSVLGMRTLYGSSCA